MSNLSLIPTTTTGGTKFGVHFLWTYKACPTRWYNRYVRPHPKGGAGCEPKFTGGALLIGSLVHEGLEQWYRSGWQDGKYKLDEAIDSMRQHYTSRLGEVKNEADAETNWLTSTKLMNDYHNYYGPDSQYPQFETMQVAADALGEPLIEAAFEIPLGYKDYVFTSRVDTIVHNQGYLAVLEHKTSAASWVGRLFAKFKLSAQATGELWALRTLFPDDDVSGIIINVLVKGKSNNPFQQDVVRRTPLDLEKFRNDTTRTLKQIDDAMGEYQGLLDKGMSTHEAATVVFDANPPADQCMGNFKCDFYETCIAKEHQEGLFATSFRPRVVEE